MTTNWTAQQVREGAPRLTNYIITDSLLSVKDPQEGFSQQD